LDESVSDSGVSLATVLDVLLDRVRRHVRDAAPEIDPRLDDYFGEARFGAAVLEADLAGLPIGARLLEIGAGALLLSCAL
jgi:hypothetical protein